MYSMIIDTPLMIPTTPTIDIMMIMVPYSLNRSSNQTRGIRRGYDSEIKLGKKMINSLIFIVIIALEAVFSSLIIALEAIG